MKKLILILALMFCLIFSGTALGFEKVDVTMVNCGLSTVYVPKIQTLIDFGLGSSTTAVPLLDDDPALTVYATSSQTSGTVQASVISLVVGGAGTIVEGLHVVVSSEYATGSWTNAVVGKIDYGSLGSASGGMAASICAEMNLAPIVSPGGSYYNVHSYFNVPTDAELIDSTAFNYAFERYELATDATHDFDLYGLLWHIVGLDDNSTKVWYENTLKIQIDETKWWIPLSLAEGMYKTTERIRIDLDADETPALHVHTHQVEIGGEGENVANDFKGEFLRTSGIADGMRLQYTMDASGTGILRTLVANAYLGSAATLSGSGMVYGLLAGVNVVGTVDGSGVELAAISAGIMNMIGGTLTEAKYTSAISLSNLATQFPAIGESQFIVMYQPDNAAVIDQAIFIFGGDRITEFVHFDDTAGMCVTDTDATTDNATHKIKCSLDGVTFYLAGFADF